MKIDFYLRPAKNHNFTCNYVFAPGSENVFNHYYLQLPTVLLVVLLFEMFKIKKLDISCNKCRLYIKRFSRNINSR